MRRFVVLFTAVALVGCGSSSESPSDVVKAFGKDFAAGRGDSACGRLTEAAKRQLTAEANNAFSCEELIKRSAQHLNDVDKKKFSSVKVTSEKVHGSSATVKTAGDDSATRLTKVDGKWLLDADAGNPRRAAASEAKSQARYAVVGLESCYVDSRSYDECRGDKLRAGVPLKLGSGPGEVEIVRTTRNSYELSSHAASGGSTFRIVKDKSGQMTRTCTPRNAQGCNDGIW